MVKVILKSQPRQVSGPFTQAQLLEIKAQQPGPQHHIHRPWKTGTTYKPNGARECQRRRVQAAHLHLWGSRRHPGRLASEV